jgi:hypothetical protein
VSPLPFDRLSGQIFQRKNWETCEAAGGAIRTQRWVLFEVQMAVFSRSFIRRRLIGVATTLTVTGASLALGHQPAAHRLHPLMKARQVSASPASADVPVPLADRPGWTPAQFCERRIHRFEATETSPPSPSPG